MTKETLVNKLLKQHRNELVLEICRQDNISESFLNFVVQSFVEIGYGEFAEKAAKLRGKPLTDTEIKKMIDGYIERGRTQEAVNIARLRPSEKLTL